MEAVEAAAAPVVTVTDRAARQIRKIIADDPSRQGKGVRLGVAGGGCSGFTYKFDFDDARPGDRVVPCDGFDVYLDVKAAIYLKGITVDHEGGLAGKGFVYVNPNATNTCGCGVSFSI